MNAFEIVIPIVLVAVMLVVFYFCRRASLRRVERNQDRFIERLNNPNGSGGASRSDGVSKVPFIGKM